MEAIESVGNQTYPESEIIVIDDGSTPPIDLTPQREAVIQNITLLRNDSPLGQATSREKGEKRATGDFIFQLDDDDRLAPESLANGISVFDDHPDIDIVFFNVKGFGARADAFDRIQGDALEIVIQRSGGVELERGLIGFPKSIFPVLLRMVPIAFQRPMAKREAWRAVTKLRRKAYGQDHPLRPPLRESEWSLYAAATRHVALITRPFYFQRCDGQGFFSIESQRAAAQKNSVEVFEHLLRLSRTETALAEWHQQTKERMARCYFDQAHACFHRGSRITATKYLWKAALLHFTIRYLRFGLRIFFPRRG